MGKLSLKLKIYLLFTYLITITSFYMFTKNGYITINVDNYFNIIFFSILTGITETYTVVFKDISFSTSFAIQLASYILFGPFSTLLIIIIGFSIRIIKVNDKYKHMFNTPFYGTLFNFCIIGISMINGNFFYKISGGITPIININQNIIRIILFCAAVFITNTFFISMLFSIIKGKNLIFSFASNVKLGILNIIIMAPLGILLSIIFRQFTYLGVVLILFPILLARYTFSLYIDAKSQYTETVNALMLAVEARDKYTEGHSQRVADLVEAIARQLKYSDSKIEHLRMASMLHDVGKIGIDDNILNKPGKLTDEEYNIIKKHPEIGYNILKDIKNLSDVKNIVKHHHERYDGKGYPDGLDKDSISIDVFIVQLADSIDAMATDRPYRKALSEEKIISELKKYSGTQFHPKVVEAYLRLKEKQ